ncbi:MAG: tyrosine-type recombinase/integrase [Labedaea sp.]
MLTTGRIRVGELGQGASCVHACPSSSPSSCSRWLDPRRDLAEWKRLLADAGVRAARLHDARHTAATVLLLLGVHSRAVMDVMGWSQASMTNRYQHITDSLGADIATRLNGFLWSEK